MIKSLHISNYALIEVLDIQFHPGFNIITGETGAGKSIILGALSLLLGGRADSKVIGDSGKKSVIEAIVTVDRRDDIREFCLQEDIEWDDTECVLRRELSPSGRSRAFINDTPVTLEQLRYVSVQLVDIHSQHQNLLLASPPYQMRILDVLAGNRQRLAKYFGLYSEYRAALKEYALTKRSIEKAHSDEEFMRYQLNKLEEAALVEGEQEELERDRDILTNLTEIKDTLLVITSALSESSPSALSLLKEASVRGSELSGMVEDTDGLVERLESVRIELQDIADSYTDLERNLQSDPGQLEEIEERLNLIYDLQRRFHKDTVGELIALKSDFGKRLEKIDNAENILQELEQKAKRAKKLCIESAREISEARKKEAVRFGEILRERAIPIGMKNLTVKIDVSPAELSSTGIDNVEFFFAFNKNQTPLPVGKTASGGEISRLMLAIKSIVADKMELPSIIFDEIDTGVSGDIANRMGELMQDISKQIQVITITHLPQVAAKGDVHYKVYKEDTDLRTTTRIDELDKEGRISELSLMLSGSADNLAARANALSLLDKK